MTIEGNLTAYEAFKRIDLLVLTQQDEIQSLQDDADRLAEIQTLFQEGP